MLNVESLKEFLNHQMPAALEMLRQMVGLNSFTANPEFGNHLVLTRRGRSAKSVAMVSHQDTVFPPEEEARHNFRWQPEGDRIYGPGTVDIKGGTVMMWLVLSALRQSAPEVFEEITWNLLLNSAEEPLSPDFGEVCRSRFDDQTIAALVFEAEGRLGDERLVVVARKGRAAWRVTVSGRGAHAGGKHRQGAN